MNPIDLNSVAWDSRYRYEYIALKSHVAFLGTTPISITVNHNLGFVPYYKGYVLFSGDSHYYFISSSSDVIYYGDSKQAQAINYYADTSNLYLSWDEFSGTLSGTFYYRIYNEEQS